MKLKTPDISVEMVFRIFRSMENSGTPSLAIGSMISKGMLK